MFIEGLRHATKRREFQTTTDGFAPYHNAIPNKLEDRCDLAQLIKVHPASVEGEARYSPAEVAAVEEVQSWAVLIRHSALGYLSPDEFENGEPKTQGNDPAERKAAKLARKDEKLQSMAQAAVPTRAEVNRANAAHSTGPCSPEGKLASSRNSLKHGLASGQLIIPGEDPAAFESLLQDLLDDHQPANTTEELLVREVAQSYWLMQRALAFQNECFAPGGIDVKRLALFLRYHTTHERAFHKALSALIRLQKERRKENRGFVSQQSASPNLELGFVSQNQLSNSSEACFVSQNAPPLLMVEAA